MLKAVCVVSANDCAVALAEHVAGSEEAFVERDEPAGGGAGHGGHPLLSTATGLPAEGHVTSAYDIALMSRELILQPPGHPPVHHHLDGHPAGRGLLPGEHQQA